MTIKIEIYGDTAAAIISQLRELIGGASLPVETNITPPADISATAAAPVVASVTAAEPEKKPVKEKKAKEEKAAEPKAEIILPEKTKYVLQDAINLAMKVAGDGSNEEVMKKLKNINVTLGIAKVSQMPADKIGVYIEEFEKAFPSGEKSNVIAAENIF